MTLLTEYRDRGVDGTVLQTVIAPQETIMLIMKPDDPPYPDEWVRECRDMLQDGSWAEDWHVIAVHGMGWDSEVIQEVWMAGGMITSLTPSHIDWVITWPEKKPYASPVDECGDPLITPETLKAAIDKHCLDVITPSGDTTGVIDTANIQAAIDGCLPPGEYEATTVSIDVAESGITAVHAFQYDGKTYMFEDKKTPLPDFKFTSEQMKWMSSNYYIQSRYGSPYLPMMSYTIDFKWSE